MHLGAAHGLLDQALRDHGPIIRFPVPQGAGELLPWLLPDRDHPLWDEVPLRSFWREVMADVGDVLHHNYLVALVEGDTFRLRVARIDRSDVDLMSIPRVQHHPLGLVAALPLHRVQVAHRLRLVAVHDIGVHGLIIAVNADMTSLSSVIRDLVTERRVHADDSGRQCHQAADR
jgi:hypothetical protein